MSGAHAPEPGRGRPQVVARQVGHARDPVELRESKPGDQVVLTEQASVQFAGGRSVRFRIISVDPRKTYAGWVWLVGYVVDALVRPPNDVRCSYSVPVCCGATSTPVGDLFQGSVRACRA